MTDLVPVRVPCPSGHHPDGDSVSLKPKLGLAGGVAAQQTIRNIAGSGMALADAEGMLMEVYVRYGVGDWDLHDEAGKAIPLNPDSLQAQLLDDFTRAVPIAEKANELYKAAVVDPLVDGALKSSRATRAARSTSASTGSQPSRRKASKPSSTSTTPMEDIELTSV